MDNYAVHADAGLTQGEEFADKGSVNRFIEVDILEHNKGGIATEFHADSLHRIVRELCERLPNRSRSSKAKLFDLGMAGEHQRSVMIPGRDNMKEPRNEPGLQGNLNQGDASERGFTWRLDNNRAARGQGRSILRVIIAVGKFHVRDDSAYPDRFFQSQNGHTWMRRRNNVPVGPNCFFGKPCYKAYSVGYLNLRFC